jgi:GTP-binding protein EngB required for normal cell division
MTSQLNCATPTGGLMDSLRFVDDLPTHIASLDIEIMAIGASLDVITSEEGDLLSKKIIESFNASKVLIDGVRQSKKDTKSCILIGASRAGKSTLMNILYGRVMNSNDGDNIDCNNSVAKIGHTTVSETVLPNYGEVQGFWEVVDTPGINENRSPLMRALVGVIVALAMHRAHEPKVLFVIGEFQLDLGANPNAGQALMDCCDLLGKDVMESIQDSKGSWGVVITKCRTNKKELVVSKMKKHVESAQSREPWNRRQDECIAITGVVKGMLDNILLENVYCTSALDGESQAYRPVSCGSIKPCDRSHFEEFMSGTSYVQVNGLTPVIALDNDYVRAIGKVFTRKVVSFLEARVTKDNETTLEIEALTPPDMLHKICANQRNKAELLERLDKTTLEMTEIAGTLRGLVGDNNVRCRCKTLVSVFGQEYEGLLRSWLGVTVDTEIMSPQSARMTTVILDQVKAAIFPMIELAQTRTSNLIGKAARLKQLLAMQAVQLGEVTRLLDDLSLFCSQTCKKDYRDQFFSFKQLQVRVRDASGDDGDYGVYGIQVSDYDTRTAFGSVECLIIRMYSNRLECASETSDVTDYCSTSHATALQDSLRERLSKGGDVPTNELMEMMYDPAPSALESALDPTLSIVFISVLKRKDRGLATPDDHRAKISHMPLRSGGVISAVLHALGEGFMFDAGDALTLSFLTRYKLQWAACQFDQSLTNFLTAYTFKAGFAVGGQVRLLVVAPPEALDDPSSIRPVGWVSANESNDLCVDKEHPLAFNLCPVKKKETANDDQWVAIRKKTDQEMASDRKVDMSGEHWSQLVVNQRRKLRMDAEQTSDPRGTFVIRPTDRFDVSDDQNTGGVAYMGLYRMSAKGNLKPLHLQTSDGTKVVSTFTGCFGTTKSYPILVLGESLGAQQQLRPGDVVTTAKGYVIVNSYTELSKVMTDLAKNPLAGKLSPCQRSRTPAGRTVATRESVMMLKVSATSSSPVQPHASKVQNAKLKK